MLLVAFDSSRPLFLFFLVALSTTSANLVALQPGPTVLPHPDANSGANYLWTSVKINDIGVMISAHDGDPGTGTEVWIVRSLDYGLTWEGPVFPKPLSARITDDNDAYPRVAYSPSTATWLCAWLSSTGTERIPFTSYSTDQGLNWSLIRALPATGISWWPDLTYISNGSFMLAWAVETPNYNNLTYYYSITADNGVDWRTPIPIYSRNSPSMVSDSSISLIPDGLGGVMAIFLSTQLGGDNDVVSCFFSLDKSSFSNPTFVNSYWNESADTNLPRLASFGSNFWMAVWDTRYFTGGTDRHLAYAISNNNGVTWFNTTHVDIVVATNGINPTIVSFSNSTAIIVVEGFDDLAVRKLFFIEVPLATVLTDPTFANFSKIISYPYFNDNREFYPRVASDKYAVVAILEGNNATLSPNGTTYLYAQALGDTICFPLGLLASFAPLSSLCGLQEIRSPTFGCLGTPPRVDFLCVAGIWQLLGASLNLTTSLSINNPALVDQSITVLASVSLNIQSNLTVVGDLDSQSGSQLRLASSSNVFIGGNLLLVDGSLVEVYSSSAGSQPTLVVGGCANFSGILRLRVEPGTLQDSVTVLLPISEYSCHSGQFRAIEVEAGQCGVVAIPDYQPSQLQVTFSLRENTCEGASIFFRLKGWSLLALAGLIQIFVRK